MYPTLAIIDPELTVSMPKGLTATTGLDVFAHAFESYACSDATPYSRMYALEAIKLFKKSFLKCVENGSDIEAREDMAWAASLAGVAITHAGTTLPHGMGQTLGGLTNAPHGASVVCCLAQITKWTLPYGMKDFATLARILDESLENESDEKAAYALPDIIFNLLKKVGVSTHFADFGFKEEQTQAFVNQMLTARVGAINHHPRVATKEDIEYLIKECM